jgi:type I restriction enzyme S subunit
MTELTLPSGWVSTLLPKVSNIATGKVDANHAVENGKYTFYTCAIGTFKSNTFSFDGDLIILPGNGANVGHVSFYKGKIEAYQRTYVIHNININPKYLYWQLKYKWKIVNQKNQFGSATNYIKMGNFTGYMLPMPPLNEQQRIANKLDQLLAQVDSIKSRIDNIPKILKRFRQSVLNAAVTGKLTEQWRGEDITNWKNIKLGEVGKGFNYGSSSKSKKEGSIPVLRMGNIQNGKLNWNDLVYTSDKKEIEKYFLKKGDVLFNRTNSPELVGKTAIYQGEKPCIYAGYLIKVQGNEKLNAEFLHIVLNSPIAIDYCQKVKTDGVSQSNINAKKLREFKFNLPPIEEQTEIVKRVESLFAFADQIEQRVKDAQARINNLTQSILAKAFRGELVPQDPNDEPASELLKRIQQERQQADALAKAAKKATTKTKTRKTKKTTVTA